MKLEKWSVVSRTSISIESPPGMLNAAACSIQPQVRVSSETSANVALPNELLVGMNFLKS